MAARSRPSQGPLVIWKPVLNLRAGSGKGNAYTDSALLNSDRSITEGRRNTEREPLTHGRRRYGGGRPPLPPEQRTDQITSRRKPGVGRQDMFR